jgi:hypothetical protein
MTEHKMRVLDGVRYRPVDYERARARAGASAPTGPLTRQLAEPFDPAATGVGVEQVLAHLAGADEAETLRVLDAEVAGKNRKALADQREQLLATARERADHGPSS